jgi:hypothetical protein
MRQKIEVRMGVHVNESRRQAEAIGVNESGAIACNAAGRTDLGYQPVLDKDVGGIRDGVLAAIDDCGRSEDDWFGSHAAMLLVTMKCEVHKDVDVG